MNHKSRSNAAGFTLIEILVVVTVLVILAAISFGVMSRVRENGRRAVCQNNLKQLALATIQYTQDNDGRFPNNLWQPQLFPYLKATSMIQCPTNQALLPRFNPDANKLIPEPPKYYVLGYFFNGQHLSSMLRGSDGNMSFYGKHEAAIASPSETWLHGDDEPGVNTGSGGTLAYGECSSAVPTLPVLLHDGGANYSFVDGHVKWLTPAAFSKMHCANVSPQ